MPDSTPEFSVIVTTFERPEPLHHLLHALSMQEYPRDRFEVVVVNDGGSAPLEPVVQPFLAKLAIRLLAQANAGPAAGRNTGIAHARGRFVAFTDDDCRPAPGWLAALERVLSACPDCMIGGSIENGLAQNPFSAASQGIADIVYDFFNADPEDARFFSSNNLAVAAELVRKIGGFDPIFPLAAAEDRDLCERWRHAGFRMIYVPAAIVRHYHPLGLRSFLFQHFSYGRGAARFHHQRAARKSSRFRDHAAFHRRWWRWLLRPLREAPLVPAMLRISLLAAWQAANAAGFVYGCLADGSGGIARPRRADRCRLK